MLLSPPLSPSRLANESEDAFINRTMTAGTAGDGGFPVSFDMNWHGGIHLTAPTGRGNSTVRAIADGTVTFVRKPTRRSPDLKHPLNYRGGWTDDGCIVIQHDTSIGFDSSTNAETTVRFFSVYMHLGAIGRLNVGDSVFRKDEIGATGSIYGVGNRMHFEIVCDDANVLKLTGRTEPFTPVTNHGRADAIFGTIWFFCPTGASFFATAPKPGQPLPAVVFTNAEALLISLKFVDGDAEFTTHHLDGSPLGPPVTAPGYAYRMVKNAIDRFGASPSAGVDVLRFGRVVGADALSPANAPNFQQLRLPTGTGFVDLHDSRVRCFSDADFPSWDGGFKSGWKLVDGATSADSRCSDIAVVEALDIDGDLVVKPEEATERLKDPATQAGLARKICKFPSEWETATVDKRFGWLKTDPRIKMSSADFARFRAHVLALCFWQGSQPGIAATHWHFHPREFIRHFRKCVWLSDRELAQCVPRKWAHLAGTTFRTSNLSSFNRAHQTVQPWTATLNRMMRKYLISQTAQRVAHFLAQVLEETGLLRFMKEGGAEGADYAPYYGRGIIQLTHSDNYRRYGNYRGFPQNNPSSNPKFREIGWDPDVLMVLDDAHFNRENAADAGGFYWASPAAANGNERADGGVALANVVSVSRLINGSVAFQKLNGLDMRLSLFIYLKYQLLDELRTASTESVTFVWRRNSAKEPVLAPDGTPVLDSHGHPVKQFFPGNHTVAFPLDPQRP